ncbi:uncharacterized protein LOC34620634 [Cyclospora cayetanensis]|uniref:Uncharacterized protein LOC34620634 n=1 Tax=Cyclospora cayetanensis TaxID=88456 RepID=A0A6P6RTM1_9EIME|nr:uncharacterized protein LOC34620634 [Cyclospora cayetanensis]
MWPSTPDCKEIVDTKGAILGERSAALLRGEFEGLGPPDLCCIFKVPQDRKFLRILVGADDLQDGAEVSFCHFVVGVDVSQPAPVAAYLCNVLRAQEQPTGWFRRGWRTVRCVYCTYNAFHQQDLRVELFCQGATPQRVEVHLLEASGQEQRASDVSSAAWGCAALCALMRSELPPDVPCLRVMRGPLGDPWGPGSSEASRVFLELFEKHAAEGDLLGLLPGVGRGTNALNEVLASHVLQALALRPCVETLASFQGSCPLMALHISRAYARRGQLEAALSALLRCLHTYPEEACVLRQLAELLLRGGFPPQVALRAATYAVELCPTVHRYWMTLARTEIGCGRWGAALLTLNAAPDVSVPFPWYPHGLPADVATFPVTEPRQCGVGYHSALWLAPVRPSLVRFGCKGRKQQPQGDSCNGLKAGAATAATLLRSPRQGTSRRRSSSSGDGEKAASSARSPAAAASPLSLSGGGQAQGRSAPSLRSIQRRPSPAADPSRSPSTARGSMGQQQHRRASSPSRHQGFGVYFGLAQDLDEETVVRTLASRIRKEQTPSKRPAQAGLEALSGRGSKSSSTAEHLRALAACRGLTLDLSERRRYAVLASLHKRIGLKGLNTLRDALFLPPSEDPEATALHALSRGPSFAGWLGTLPAEISTATTQEATTGAIGVSSLDGCVSPAGRQERLASPAFIEADEASEAPAHRVAEIHADAALSSACSCSDDSSSPPTKGELLAANVCTGGSAGEPPSEGACSSAAALSLSEAHGAVGRSLPPTNLADGSPCRGASPAANAGESAATPATEGPVEGAQEISASGEACERGGGQGNAHGGDQITLQPCTASPLPGCATAARGVASEQELLAACRTLLSAEASSMPVAADGGVLRPLTPSLGALLEVQCNEAPLPPEAAAFVRMPSANGPFPV